MLTNHEIVDIAMRQSAIDINCSPADFLKEENVIVAGNIGEGAKKYYKEPIACNLVSYGNNIVASVKDEYREVIAEYIGKYEFYRCFETPNMHWINDRVSKMGQKVCFMAEYWLPDMTRLALCEDAHAFSDVECRKNAMQSDILCSGYTTRVLEQKDFEKLYLPEWSNALCEDRKELDVLGVGAYDGDKLIGLAGCSADCDSMWQIGVDVLPEYRKRGIASTLTSQLALEILKRGKVPFYCCAWSNIRSAKNAIKSGFAPAWVEMTIKPDSVVKEMNGD